MIEKRTLGETGIEVSRLCFGSLTIGPLQANMSMEEGASIMAYGIEKGINFTDTAELYGTYPYIKRAIEITGKKDFIVASKSYAYSEKTAEASLKMALDGIGRDYIDMFLLHEQESEHTLRGHYEALEYYNKMKEKGYIRAIGLSTHFVAGVNAAIKDDLIDVIHPIINKNGLGIQDGNAEDMITALNIAHKRGIGIFGMKPLGGGNLINSVEECFDFVLDLSSLDSIAVGMQSKEEIDYNIQYLKNRKVPEIIKNAVNKISRKLLIHDWCTGCGKCVEKCQHKALSKNEGKIIVNNERCVLCGYCSAYCPEFCIKVV